MHIKTHALGSDGSIHMPSYMRHGYNNLIPWQYLACGDYVRIKGCFVEYFFSYRKQLELLSLENLKRVAQIDAKSYSNKRATCQANLI